jgi:hypothetical protein
VLRAPLSNGKVMKITVCFHDRCFDGACSAAVFTRFYRTCINPAAEFVYKGLAHRAGQLFPESIFDGEENAIVDFKYSSSPLLTWWFDHHQSAFLTEADAEHFQHDKSGKKFHGPDFRSCTKFIAQIAREQFGFDAQDLGELIYWADLIDGAQYPDSKTAVEMRDPATQITLVMEGTSAKDLSARLIPELVSKPLRDIAALPYVRSEFEQLYQRHVKSMEVIRKRAELKDQVIFFDVVDLDFEGFNKFIPYYLFPTALYSVALSRSPERIKISVGSNPWNSTPRPANLASICERYGGGGHAKVAAISLPPGDSVRAREVAHEIVQELRSNRE